MLFPMNSFPITGGCLCGAIRYEGHSDVWNVTHCHCIDCRRASAAAFVTWASFKTSQFHFISGEPEEIAWAGRLRGFCPKCGTPLTFKSSADADEIDVTVCSFDHPELVTPADHTWMEDRIPWISLADKLPTHLKVRPDHTSE